MKYIVEFINQYGLGFVYTAITAIAGWLGVKIKKVYEQHIADDTKRKTVETCVKAVEQLAKTIYKGLSGAEKYQKAKENIVALLDAKGIAITEIEIDMLIESAVSEFNINVITLGGVAETEGT